MTIPHLRPQEARLVVERKSSDGICPECGAEKLAAYQVLAETGWVDVIKCQACLCSVSRTPGPLLGPIELLSERV
jgi:hypothetical protein